MSFETHKLCKKLLWFLFNNILNNHCEKRFSMKIYKIY